MLHAGSEKPLTGKASGWDVPQFRSGWTKRAQSLDLLPKGDCAKGSPLCTLLEKYWYLSNVEALLLDAAVLFFPFPSLEVGKMSPNNCKMRLVGVTFGHLATLFSKTPVEEVA